MEGSESLVQRLSKYTKGTWSGFINQPTNVDINKKFVVFSVRDMEDDLKPVAMYLITHYIWNTVRKNLKKRLLVIDEAWWMMKSEDTASFLYGMAKRGRKYYLGLSNYHPRRRRLLEVALRAADDHQLINTNLA
jgi:conjugal transfer ATP-binding protein TraC